MHFTNINYNLFKSFLAVYEKKNISKAGELILLAPSSISYNIRELETQLDVKLFIGHTKGVDPTPEADELAKVLRNAFAQLKNAENIVKEFHALDRGIIRIGCTSIIATKYLTGFIAQFNQRYPNIKIQLTSNNRADSMRELNNHNIDVLISFASSKPIDKEYEQIILRQSYNSFFCSKDFAKKHNINNIITVKKLSQLPVLLLTQSLSFATKMKQALGIEFNSQIEVSSQELVYDLAVKGVGIGYGTGDILDTKDDIIKLNVQGFEPTPTHIECLYNKDVINRPAKVFIEEVVEYFNSLVVA